jgi:hypothetical protein
MVRHALRIEDVVGLEVGLVGLIELGDRHRFQREAVVREVIGDQPHDFLQEFVALGVELLERLAGGCRSERRHELVLDELGDALLIARSGFVILLAHLVTERARRGLDGIVFSLDPDEELGLDVGAQLVAGDERVDSLPEHVETDGLERDSHDLMHDREDQGAAVSDDPQTLPHLTAKRMPWSGQLAGQCRSAMWLDVCGAPARSPVVARLPEQVRFWHHEQHGQP